MEIVQSQFVEHMAAKAGTLPPKPNAWSTCSSILFTANLAAGNIVEFAGCFQFSVSHMRRAPASVP
jgi:hypothetical protein